MHEYKYKTYRKIYKKVAHEAEITYYKERFDLRKNSTKELWANLNKVCSLKKKSGAHQMVLKIIVNNKELTQLTDISNGLIAYFTSVSENLVKDIDR